MPHSKLMLVKVPDVKHFFHIGRWIFLKKRWDSPQILQRARRIYLLTYSPSRFSILPTKFFLMDFWKFFSGPFLEFFRIFDPNFFWKFWKTIAAIWYLLPFSTMLFQMQQKFPPVFPVFSEKNFVWHSVFPASPVIVNLLWVGVSSAPGRFGAAAYNSR